MDKSIIIIAISEWNDRFQRSQEIAKEYKNQGYNVFYVSPNLVSRLGYKFQIYAKVEDRIFLTKFASVNYRISPYDFSYLDEDECKRIARNIIEFVAFHKIINPKILVQSPGWVRLGLFLPHFKLIYDIMDYHLGFHGDSIDLHPIEIKAFKQFDSISVTSQYLFDLVNKDKVYEPTIIRNAVRKSEEFINFSSRKTSKLNKEIIYFGAIDAWFDIELVVEVVKRLSDWQFKFIGNTIPQVLESLQEYSNVHFLGEIPKSELIKNIGNPDVGIIPFRLSRLILATNPVKLYEYAALGIPTVATRMPEVRDLPDYIVRSADNAEMFITNIIDSANSNSVENINRRIKWSDQNTWSHRLNELEKLSSDHIHSIIVLAFGDSNVTSKCVKAIIDNCDRDRTELIIIDNGSSEGIVDLIHEVSKLFKYFKYRKTHRNLGFAGGMNFGIRLSIGRYITLMNNDVTIGTGWQTIVERYINKNKEIGAVCPLTDNCGNEAAVDFVEHNNENWDKNKLSFEIENTGIFFEVKTLGFYNVTLSREAIESCGELSEDYGLGMFEDDDYCRKLEKKGFKKIIILDSIVRHAMSENFDKLDPRVKQELFNKNKKIYEERWGKWIPHKYLDPKLNIDLYIKNKDTDILKKIVKSNKYKFYRYGDLIQ